MIYTMQPQETSLWLRLMPQIGAEWDLWHNCP